MNIIFKKNLRTTTFQSNKLSKFSNDLIAVVSDSVILNTESDTGEVIDNYPEKYRIGWIKDYNNSYSVNRQCVVPNTDIQEGELVFDICTGITLMNKEEQEQEIIKEQEQVRINSFRNYSIKVIGNTKQAREELLAFSVEALLLDLDRHIDKKFTVSSENYILSLDKTLTIFLNYIELEDLNKLELIEGIKFEVIGKDENIYTKLPNGYYKYIIPQPI